MPYLTTSEKLARLTFYRLLSGFRSKIGRTWPKNGFSPHREKSGQKNAPESHFWTFSGDRAFGPTLGKIAEKRIFASRGKMGRKMPQNLIFGTFSGDFAFFRPFFPPVRRNPFFGHVFPIFGLKVRKQSVAGHLDLKASEELGCLATGTGR